MHSPCISLCMGNTQVTHGEHTGGLYAFPMDAFPCIPLHRETHGEHMGNAQGGLYAFPCTCIPVHSNQNPSKSTKIFVHPHKIIHTMSFYIVSPFIDAIIS